jgi:hypothetical protein
MRSFFAFWCNCQQNILTSLPGIGYKQSKTIGEWP